MCSLARENFSNCLHARIYREPNLHLRKKNGAGNNVSRMAKLKKDGEIGTSYMNVSKNMFPRFIETDSR